MHDSNILMLCPIILLGRCNKSNSTRTSFRGKGHKTIPCEVGISYTICRNSLGESRLDLLSRPLKTYRIWVHASSIHIFHLFTLTIFHQEQFSLSLLDLGLNHTQRIPLAKPMAFFYPVTHELWLTTFEYCLGHVQYSDKYLRTTLNNRIW